MNSALNKSIYDIIASNPDKEKNIKLARDMNIHAIEKKKGFKSHVASFFTNAVGHNFKNFKSFLALTVCNSFLLSYFQSASIATYNGMNFKTGLDFVTSRGTPLALATIGIVTGATVVYTTARYCSRVIANHNFKKKYPNLYNQITEAVKNNYDENYEEENERTAGRVLRPEGSSA